MEVWSWAHHGCEPRSWECPRVSLCPEPGLNALLFPRPWPALGPCPGPGPASGDGRCPGALWAPGRVLGPGPWLETDASPSLQPGLRPRPATSPLPPQRQEAARALFLQRFGGLLLQATSGRSPRNIIKERASERESGREVWKNHLIPLCKDNCSYVSEGFEVTSDSNRAG